MMGQMMTRVMMIPMKATMLSAKIMAKFLLKTRVGQGLLFLAIVELIAAQFVPESATIVAVLFGIGVAGMITAYRLPERGGAATGRGEFDVGFVSRILPSRSAENAPVKVDKVVKKDNDASSTPNVVRDRSTVLAGQSGQGKSKMAKSLAIDWPDGMTMAHAVSEVGGNEFGNWYRDRGFDVRKFSTRGSSVRVDPFLDTESNVSGYENIAHGVFNSRQIPSTGWDPGAQALLLGAIIRTDIEHGDFGYLGQVLGEPPEEIIDTIGRVNNPNIGSLQQQFRLMDEDAMTTMYGRLSNRLRPLLNTDIFDPSLPAVSLQDEFRRADDDTVLLLDSRRKDKAARGFWRWILQRAITLSYQVDTQQRFLIDEADKLPEIPNLGELASAGRSASTRGIIIFQNVDQIDERYGESGRRTIWSNSPNRFMFKPGDSKTAAQALDSIGEYEVESRDVSSGSRNPFDKTVSKSRGDKTPIVSSDLFKLGKGEALIQSDDGWWLADLTERDV